MNEPIDDETRRRQFLDRGIEFFCANGTSSNRDVIRNFASRLTQLNDTTIDSTKVIATELKDLGSQIDSAKFDTGQKLDLLTQAIQELSGVAESSISSLVKAIEASSESTTLYSKRLNRLTLAYVILTGGIVIVTAVQAWKAFQ